MKSVNFSPLSARNWRKIKALKLRKNWQGFVGSAQCSSLCSAKVAHTTLHLCRRCGNMMLVKQLTPVLLYLRIVFL